MSNQLPAFAWETWCGQTRGYGPWPAPVILHDPDPFRAPSIGDTGHVVQAHIWMLGASSWTVGRQPIRQVSKAHRVGGHRIDRS